jgi:thiamine biosynthesis lipoprotein
MSPEIVRHAFEAMGSRCELLAVDPAPGALKDGEAWVRRAETRFSRFEPNSELSALNRSGGAWIGVSDPMLRMLVAAREAWTRSEGLVNAAILPALQAAGYTRRFAEGPTAPAALAPGPLPALHEALEIDLKGRRARLAPGCGLDFGGIAKGALADELAPRLGANALCNLGGDLRACGDGLGHGWLVGLPNGQTVSLTAGALGTSGTTRRRWGDGLHHLIDPRSGAPARSDVAIVSVAAPDALSAEIYAKTALLLGSELGGRFLRGRGLFHIILREASA